MLHVTLTLTAQEWIKLRDAALQAFPNELLSRGEITRRYTLAGVETLKDLSDQDRSRMQHRYQATMTARRRG